MTAGFGIRDGKVAWRDVGTSYECSPLPCAGMLQLQGRSIGGAYAPTVGVRLRTTGTLTQPPHSDLVISKDTAVVLEGFDLASGKTLWTFDTGRNVDLINNEPPPQTDESTVVLREPDGTLVALDLETGEHRTVAADTRAWCRTSSGYMARDPSGTLTSYRGQRAAFACDARGRRVPTGAEVPAFVGKIGVTVGGLAVWAAPNGVVAAPVAR